MSAALAAALVGALLGDLEAESADLDGRVATAQDWSLPTPAEGWDVADTIAHLAATDRDALQAVTDPDTFLSRLLSEVAAEGAGYVDRLVAEQRGLPREDLLAEWREGRAELAAAIAAHDPSVRVPWFGPPMSVASFVSARIMETWAHGQDVVDALGQEREPTARLRSVAEIGVRARAFSYANCGRALPEAPVHVSLAAPGGERWEWGPPEAADAVRGPALDFCLLVTQRRHRSELDLEVVGPAAREWMEIAQAFAGPPGGGRKPR